MIFWTPRGAVAQSCNFKRDSCGFDFHLGGKKEVGKERLVVEPTECLTTKFSLPTLPYADYSVN